VGIRRNVRIDFNVFNSGLKTGISNDMIRVRITDNNIKEEINKVNLKKKEILSFLAFMGYSAFFYCNLFSFSFNSF
jgi:hypothetical protein